MWKKRLQNIYDDFDEWLYYCDIYHLAERLGYDSPEQAWKENPIIQGSINPRDYRIAEWN